MEWVNYWFTDEGVLLANYGVEGESYTMDENGKPQYTELMKPDNYYVYMANFQSMHFAGRDSYFEAGIAPAYLAFILAMALAGFFLCRKKSLRSEELLPLISRIPLEFLTVAAVVLFSTTSLVIQYIYEYQKSQYCGLESSLEPFSQKFLQQKITEERTELQRMLTPVNTILVLANVVVFMILSFLGNTTDAEFMAAHGAIDWMDVVEKHQYYRLFTSMFLHFGADHLLQNMLILLVIGCRLERITGNYHIYSYILEQA